jgi:hypothetical protein
VIILKGNFIEVRKGKRNRRRSDKKNRKQICHLLEKFVMYGTFFFSLIHSKDCNNISIDLIVDLRFNNYFSHCLSLGQTLDRKKGILLPFSRV